MKYAKKINLPLDFNSIPITRKIQTLTTSNSKFSKFDCFYIKQKDVEKIRSVLPAAIQSNLLSVLATSYSILSPHVHLKEKSVINFYKQVNGEVTTFYEGNVERDDSIVNESGNLYVVKLENIYPFEQICAEQGDLWILDTAQPHSVTLSGDTRVGVEKYFAMNDRERLLIQMYFDIPFQNLVEVFDSEVC